MEYEEKYDYTDTSEDTPDVELPHRKTTPYQKKQKDYKHESRLLSSGNRGYRRASKLLPHIERRSYRHALDATAQPGKGSEDDDLISGDKLKSVKRSMFSRLVSRKSVPLKQALQTKKASREARSNRHSQQPQTE